MRFLPIIFIFFLSGIQLSNAQFTPDIERGLIAWFPFNADAKDTLGPNNGTVYKARFEEGRCGQNAYYFNGGDSYIDCGNDRSLNGRFAGLTVAVWMRPMETSELQLGSVVTKWAFDPIRDHFGMWINKSYKIIFAVSNRSKREDGTFSKTSLQPREWHHVVGTWRSNGEIRIYIDGKLDNIGRQTGRGINTTSNVSLKIGRQKVRRDRPYKGYVEEVRIYNRALHPEEVAALYNLSKDVCNQIIVMGQVINKNSGEPLNGTVIYEDMTDGTEFARVQSTGDLAEYTIKLPIGKKFACYAQRDGYLSESQMLSTRDRQPQEVIHRDLYLVPMTAGSFIRLNNIFFDFDKATLRSESFAELDRLLPLFLRFPNMKIEIAGHTDSKGSDEYNIRLSKARAGAVRAYLVKNDVEPTRIIAMGYGESVPIDTNETDEGRQQNRRVEFKILENRPVNTVSSSVASGDAPN